MKNSKMPGAPKPKAEKAPPLPASDDAGDTLDSVAHATPDGTPDGQVERERPSGSASESDADSRSQRRDLVP